MSIPAHHQASAVQFESGNDLIFDCCVQCGRQIPSAFQIKNPGTDVCDYCSVIHVGVDFHEEER